MVLVGFSGRQASADEVTDWTQIMLTANHMAAVNPLVASRNAAIVEASIFDAVNGVKGLYSPIHVDPAAPKGASARAAAVQAAYVSLMHLYPTQAATFNAARAASLAAILTVNGGTNVQQKVQSAVDSGIGWGAASCRRDLELEAHRWFHAGSGTVPGRYRCGRLASDTSCVCRRRIAAIRHDDAMGHLETRPVPACRPPSSRQRAVCAGL